MRILITNNTLAERAGSELYVRDLALELLRRGHRPIAFSTNLGKVAEELRAGGVPVLSSLASIAEPPDIIHGHHHRMALIAMLAFPQTPAIHYCHGWLPAEEAPLRFPRIVRYVAVDEICRERLMVEGGIPAEDIETIYNFFDPVRFLPRGPLPATPRKAIVFSNEFRDGNGLEILREACQRQGIELATMGLATGRAEQWPGRILAGYDIVFAKGRAAIEGMAIGNAVILCRPGHLGPMVTTDNFTSLRRLNFGMQTMTRPLSVELVETELLRYDKTNAAAVSRTVCEQCTLSEAVDRIIDLYGRVIETWNSGREQLSGEAERAAARYMENMSSQHMRDSAELARANCLMEQQSESIRQLQAEAERLRRQSNRTEQKWAQAELQNCEHVRRQAEAAQREDELLLRLQCAGEQVQAMQTSATWRWTQALLNSWPLRLALGPVIRAVAVRSAALKNGV